jgi:serine/threonine-protein kinase
MMSGTPGEPSYESGARAISDLRSFDASLVAGDVIDGRYVIERGLAEGGMGVVYLARHVELEQPVAIKFLRSDLCDRPSVVQRFLNEARAAASLRGDHIVRVIDVGQLASGRPFLVMEHLDGVDLDALIEQEGPLGIERAIDYVLQVCDALKEAHDKHIIHRDIKPENLFLQNGHRGKVVKVLDFGLAKRVDSNPGLTGPQDSMGSPYYMSPEQILTPHAVDARTDIWSLGVVLYRFLTGAVPFGGNTMTEVYAHVLNAAPMPPSALNPAIDPALDAIVLGCIQKDAERRFRTISELALALQGYVHRRASPSEHSAVRHFPTEDDSPVLIPGVHRGRRVPDDGAISPETPGVRGRRRFAKDDAGGAERRGRSSRWPATLAVMVVLGAAAFAYEERDAKSIVIDMNAVGARATSELLRIDAIRRLNDRFAVVPNLVAAPGVLWVPQPFEVAPLEPSGVVARAPAFDSSGRTLRAEPERGAEGPKDDEASSETTIDKPARYREYLRQHGLVPLHDVLEQMNHGAPHSAAQ